MPDRQFDGVASVLLSASHAPKKDGPRPAGFLTRGLTRRFRSSRAKGSPVTSIGGFEDVPSGSGLTTRRHVHLRTRPWNSASRLQWRDRVGFPPTSRGRRGERQVKLPTISQPPGTV